MVKTDYAEYVWNLYEQVMSSRSNEDYVADKLQMTKLIKAYAFFKEIAEIDSGRVEPLKLVPKEISSGITAYFKVFYLTGENLRKFGEICENLAGLSIDSLTDGSVCISFTVPNVFKRKCE